MANGSFGEVFGSRLSQAGSQLLPLFQLIQNTQRQNDQDVFNRNVQIQQFENQAEQLKQGRERIGISERQANIAQQRFDLTFATEQKRILGTLGGPEGVDFSGLPRTLEGVFAGRLASGLTPGQAGAGISEGQQLLDPEVVASLTPAQQVGGDIFEAVQTGAAAEDIRQAKFRGEQQRAAFPILGGGGLPVTETEPLFDTAAAIRGQLFGGVEDFDPNDPAQVQQALTTAGQISPELGGFIEREGLSADTTPAAPAPVGIQGQGLFDLANDGGAVFDTAQQQGLSIASWQGLTPRQQTDFAREQARIDHAEFDTATADRQQELIQETVNEIESALGII